MADDPLSPPPPPPPPPSPPPPPPPPAAWHVGKVDADLLGVMQNKGWKVDDAAAVAVEATKAYREAQSLLGVPKDQLLRIPAASAPEADLKAFWGRLGAVDDPKAIDLSTIKTASGQPVDPKLADVLAAVTVSARIPKDAALSIAGALVKHFDNADAEAAAIKAGNIKAEKDALDKNWGTNKAAFMVDAERGLQRLAAAAGVPPDKAKAAWDALSHVGGIGAAAALEMLRTFHTKVGEDKWVQVGGTGSGNLPVTREAAKAEIAALKKDPDFTKRYTAGGAVETKRMTDLHAIAYAQQAA